MFDLTGRPLLALSILLALAVPALCALLWMRGATSRRAKPRRVWGAVRLLMLVGLAQVLAISAVALGVNRSFSFYTNWSDLWGSTRQDSQIKVNAGGSVAGSRIEALPVPIGGSQSQADALVWLPAQYDDPSYASKRFPVLMFLPGQPSTPQALFTKFNFGEVASKAIASGKVPPFVAVIPPIMIDPPRDTECTDVPNGPQAQTFLSDEVPKAVVAKYRVQPTGPGWSVAGWSTGAFCAAKIGLTHPTSFASAISIGGYFRAVQDRTTGDLFGGDRAVKQRNSPLWLYKQSGLRGLRMLLISGKQDRGSWPSTSKMLAATKGDKGVSYVDFPEGGHNFHNYQAYLEPALVWAKLPAPKAP